MSRQRSYQDSLRRGRSSSEHPKEGLPAVDEKGWKAIPPLQLWQLLKSAYGLTESPQLWCLEAIDRLKKTDLKKLKICNGVFVASSNDESWAGWAVLVLHVDDGLLLGDPNDPRFKGLR